MITEIWNKPAVIAENHFKFKSLSNWSYNNAVGCNHACRFCVSGDTLIQLADGQTIPIRLVNVGDRILTVDQTTKRICEATVTAKAKTFKPAYKIFTSGGSDVVCSDDHRWLTTRGWKFTTGDEQGKLRRAHLTDKSLIYTIGSSVDPFVVNDDYRRGYLSGIIRGDGVLGTYEYKARKGIGKEKQSHFRLFMRDKEPVSRAKSYLERFGVPVSDFTFTIQSGEYAGRSYDGIRNHSKSANAKIESLVAISEDAHWRRGWIAGFFDAEGSACGGACLRMSNGNQKWLDVTKSALDHFDFDSVFEHGKEKTSNIRIRGGYPENFRFFQIASPVLTRKMGVMGKMVKTQSKVEEIQNLGVSIEMYDITTTSETFIANGLVAHNCYVPDVSTIKLSDKLLKLGVKDPDAEWGEYVFPRKWQEETFKASLRSADKTPISKLKPDGNRAVMLCTTTDPYQVLKSKDHMAELEKTVREALRIIESDSTLNVRILTRSPLAKRDFDLMKKFGNRLLFGMSIPTLKNDIAKIYEPKAPAPTQRLATLKAARDAGLNVYVAMAPTYPECDAEDMQNTLVALKELNPVTIFHEPVNIRANNVERIRKHAASLGYYPHMDEFKTVENWREYSIQQLLRVEELASFLRIDQLHLWPDAALGSRAAILQAEHGGRRTNHLQWLQKWWNRISEWPNVEQKQPDLI
jgi:DNA repair photolyase